MLVALAMHDTINLPRRLCEAIERMSGCWRRPRTAGLEVALARRSGRAVGARSRGLYREPAVSRPVVAAAGLRARPAGRGTAHRPLEVGSVRRAPLGSPDGGDPPPRAAGRPRSSCSICWPRRAADAVAGDCRVIRVNTRAAVEQRRKVSSRCATMTSPRCARSSKRTRASILAPRSAPSSTHGWRGACGRSGHKTFREYREYLERESDSELSQFRDAITTNLTSFFREPHHFEHLREKVLRPWMAARRCRERLRIWSAGCSTGEEPYSIAMTVMETARRPAALGRADPGNRPRFPGAGHGPPRQLCRRPHGGNQCRAARALFSRARDRSRGRRAHRGRIAARAGHFQAVEPDGRRCR